MALLDELSGYEFEDLMVDVFRHLGYENVRQSARTADEGRDILMEEVVDGRRRAVVVECKHTDTVSRPVVQKLHSAVATYDYDGPKRGMVATTGRFTRPAREYAAELGTTTDGGVELVDGTDLREIGEEIGMDLYNGRIEILCEEALAPTHPTAGRDAPVFETLRDVRNIAPETVPTPETSVAFEPMVTVSANTSATFETSVGVIHSLNETTDLVLHAGGDEPRVARGERRDLVTDRTAPRVSLEERKTELECTFDELEYTRFGRTETAYKEWAIDRLRQVHTTTVHYTGDNNVDYEKTCTPNRSDVSVRSIDPVYLPRVRSRLALGEYEYRYVYDAAGSSRAVVRNEFRECVHCETSGVGGSYTYCDNCGSINCEDHIRTERLEDEPVCTGCAVTERFALKTKYFYDEENREAFRAEYEEMALHEKAMENVPLAVGCVLALLFTLFVVASSVGVV
ncbi:homolog to restriction system mrr [Natrialba magadii ATCC 43099]|uniref:Homolog to restriction system mrr n=1 Tax=Natrialba magadii (strain ATCC 43099 / DSM 3394 / CCM 3739 / CIP 104546 / IAM 13178 / JCM 8861 / NBRC 102185 / NCIMB 2190 / MS3) TaxID=547559 RepID=D3SSU5_NATMM|nr:restriction endonuclease [Natrialba magadii]ADD04891.1 homolog to restriction system mrr [Natrialba magadii ATCC 43099]ELY23940.1 restriction endonuclease [Natrialba magadii ATCC 43099]